MIKYLILTLLLILNTIELFAQLQVTKEKRYVVLYENEKPIDTLIGSPGLLMDYKIINRYHIILIIDARGRISYDNLKYDGVGWRLEESSCQLTNQSIIGTVPRNNEIRKIYTFKIVDVDKVEKFENNVSAGFVDFESIMKSKKEYKESMEKLWNERQSKNKN